MAIDVVDVSEPQVISLLGKGESHFLDFKSKAIQPAKLTKLLSAFANADGGELFVGIEDGGASRWQGFAAAEDANQFIQVFEEFFPLSQFSRYEFLRCTGRPGLVLKCEVLKTPDVRKASDGIAYLRRGAQSLPQKNDEQMQRLKLNKGVLSYEDFPTAASQDLVAKSDAIRIFLSDVIPTTKARPWLVKQMLIVDDKPTVAGVVLYADEPQAVLPKTGVKLYRYRTSGEGSRDTLADNPISIEGNAYKQIFEAVERVIALVESIPITGSTGLEKIAYPREALHEIITNSVLHRDYSLNDDIHIRVYDNRIEVQSPGVLPGHLTVKNILNERFARNPRIVRLLNKYKNPPNKDVGEGLRTAFEAMRKVTLKDPLIEQFENNVRVTLRHEKLASHEDIICEYLSTHDEINNSKAREITFIGSENAVKRLFQKMIEAGLIERIAARSLAKTGYKKGSNFPRGKYS